MAELLAIFREFTPGTYGIWTGVLMFAAWLLREWRETRKLSADDRLARREGYAKQVESLSVENRNLRREIQEVRQAHDDYRRLCHAETDQLRQQIIEMQNYVAGLERQIAAAAGAAFRHVGNGSRDVIAAAERVERIRGGDKPSES